VTVSYFDLEYKLRTDPSYRRELSGVLHSYSDTLELVKSGNAEAAKKGECVTDLIKACGKNLGLLIPYYFPRYPRREPLTLRDYPQMYPVMQLSPKHGSLTIRGSRQIGKTLAIIARQSIITKIIPGYKILYVVPLAEQQRTFGNKFKSMYEAFSARQSVHKYREDLYYREIKTADPRMYSTLRMMYILTNASKARGETVDELEIDEMQDFDPDLLEELEEIVEASPFAWFLYSGTSLHTYTALENKYAASSRGTWAIRCPACHFENWGDLDCEYYGPSGKKDIMDMAREDGLHCLKCDGMLYPEDGRFLHRDLAAYAANDIGIHVPQVMVPGFLYDEPRYARLIKKKKSGDRRKLLQEKFGIPVEEGEREISEAQLINICVLGDNIEALRTKAVEGKYRAVASGVDWGGTDFRRETKTKKSYTVHTIVGCAHDDERHLDILHMRQYSGMLWREVAGNIMHDHQRFNASVMATDAGAGDLYNNLITRRIGDPRKHFVMRYDDPGRPYVSIPQDVQVFNMWNLNRTESISTLYSYIQDKRLRCYSWSLAGPLLRLIMNMYRHPSEDSKGRTKFLYRRDASKADDTLHSLNFAITILRMVLHEPLFSERGSRMQFEQHMAEIERGGGPMMSEGVSSLEGW